MLSPELEKAHVATPSLVQMERMPPVSSTAVFSTDSAFACTRLGLARVLCGLSGVTAVNGVRQIQVACSQH